MLEKKPGKGGDPNLPLAQPFSALFSWLSVFLSIMCFQERLPPQTPAPSSDSQAASPAPSSASTHTPWGCSTHESVRVCHMCVQGHLGGQAWALCPMCVWPHEQPGSRGTFRNLCLTFPLKHKPTCQANFGVSVYCMGFLLFGSLFGYFPLSGGGVGGLHMQGSAPVLSQRPIGPPTPFLQHMCTTCKVSPPSRKKESPPSQ